MAQFSNWEEVEKAVADTVLREEAGGWVVVGYHGTDKTISFVGEGTKGIEELKRVLTDDHFYYALIRVANPKELAHSVKARRRVNRIRSSSLLSGCTDDVPGHFLCLPGAQGADHEARQARGAPGSGQQEV
jgi:hypothetical protein